MQLIMESLYLSFLYTILLLFLFPQSLNSQEIYLNNTVSDCSDNPSAPKGYLCNNTPQNSCTSFLVFTSKPPYNNPSSIAYLLGSEATNIASINNISRDDKISANKSIIVPILCSCSGNIYQHNTPYTVKKDDTYYKLVTETYQSLTTCQSMKGQNYYASEDIVIGAELTIPILCACPTKNQTAKGVTSLLVYTVDFGDTVKSIGEAYGVDEQSIVEANELSNSNVMLSAVTPLLVPLRGKSCKEDPESFYCTCSKGMLVDASSNRLYCDESDGEKFPVKLVAALGVGLGAGFLCLFLLGYKLSIHTEKERNYPKGKPVQAKWWLLITREALIIWKWRNGKAFYSRRIAKSNFLQQKNCKEQQITITKVDFLVKVVMVLYIKECYQMEL